jgi:DNA-directed RNA polymerase specialized sigma24 family protein
MASGNIPDDVPDGTSAVSSGSQPSMNGLARDWALCGERERADQLFEALVRAVEAELLSSARALASKLLGANDVEDAISTVWMKLLAKRNGAIGPGQARHDVSSEQAGNKDSPGAQHVGFDPGRGTFRTFFLTVLNNTCHDILRHRNATQLPSADATTGEALPQSGLFPIVTGHEDEIVQRIESIQDRITAVIEVLDLSERHREMLRLMLETEEDAPPADAKAVVTARQQKKRLRDKVAKLAGLTPDELKAASLVRTHHTVATAAAAAPGLDVPRLFASAKRKVFALFDIETED